MTTATAPALILASGSRYRRELLGRITDSATIEVPDSDESPAPGEAPARLAARLALLKAETIATRHPSAVTIGSDQVAALDAQILGKPGNPARAAEQLSACSGREVRFYTAVCVLRPESGFRQEYTDLTTVKFRVLSAAQINAYLEYDQPWDCAGSFKSEGRGVALFEAIESTDPTALIGLPLIWLAHSLEQAGIKIL